MIGHRMGASVMMQLGSFQFGISTAAYQELTRRSEYRWPGQDRMGVEPALQFTGPASESITLSGTIYTEYRGGTGQPGGLRALAAGGRPLALVDGQGRMLGQWVVESVEEKQSVFANAGVPRKQEFSLQLKKFPDAPPGFGSLASVAAGIAGAAGGEGLKVAWSADATKQAAQQATFMGKVKGFATTAAASVGSAVKTATETLAAVQAKAAEIGNAIAPVVSTARQALATANNLRAAVENVQASVQGATSLAGLQSAMFSVQGLASSAANASALASNAAGMMGISLPAASPETKQLISDCRAAYGKAATVATSTYNDAAQISDSIRDLVALK